MNFLIITQAFHYKNNQQILSYEPYVREMNLWLQKVEKVHVIAPVLKDYDPNINLAYPHKDIYLLEVLPLSLISVQNILKTIIHLPKIMWTIYQEMRKADHIHLRCPGNMGLLGCLIQIAFPKKKKTAKYAGNWDPRAKQPWSYNLQKWILKNTVITKNMKVLVYGNWPKQSANIQPFFTASYYEKEKQDLYLRNYSNKIKFCFIGTLSTSKQPNIALDMVRKIRGENIEATLSFFGDGHLKQSIEDDIFTNNEENWAKLHGNKDKRVITSTLKFSHFLILPSKSEGWPKVVAEAMFWGCIPIVSSVSCIPWMLDNGKRGIIIIDEKIEECISDLLQLLQQPNTLEKMAITASLWSRKYTMDKFEDEIAKLLLDNDD